MPGYSASTRAAIAFKKLIGLANTNVSSAFYNESIPSQVSIFSDEIAAEVIDEDPSVAISEGTVEFVECELTEILSSNGYAYNIRFPSNYGGFFGTSVQGDLIRDHTQIIPKKFNVEFARQDNTGGYGYDLYDDGTRVPITSDKKWFVDPVAGVVTSDENEPTLDLINGTLRVYIYIGDFINDIFTLPDSQIAIGTGQTGYEGRSDFTFDGSDFEVGGSVTIKDGGTFGFNTSNSKSTRVKDISTNQSLGGNLTSDDLLATQKAIKEYVDDQTGGGGGGSGGIKIEDDGTTVLTGVSSVNFGERLFVSDDGDGTVTVDSIVSSEFIQDVVFNSVFGGEDVEVDYNDSLDKLTVDIVDRIDLGTL